MIPRLLAIAALALPLGAHAADWVQVDVADQQQHAYDRGNLSIEGNEITYWRRVLFRVPQPAAGGTARMAMYRERIDCKAHTFRTLGYLLYAQDGAVLENVYTPDAEPEAIAPATVGERFEALMCAFVESPRAAQPAAASGSKEVQELQEEIQQLETRLRVLKQRLQEVGASQAAGGQR
jgi:uncharacterized protein YceH (UPF0502 family)